MLLFICLAISFTSFYLDYNNNNDNDNNNIKNDNRNIKNKIEIRNDNNIEKNNKYLGYNYNKTKLKKNFLLAAFIIHIGMLSRLFFFISGHNFDFGSLQVRYNNS